MLSTKEERRFLFEFWIQTIHFLSISIKLIIKNFKKTQNLLISFDKFQPKLIDLFSRCSNTPNPILSSSSGSSYILAIKNLSHSSLTLEIIELNEFRNIVHLSFEIPSAGEEFVRSNYCSIYRKLKNEIEQYKQQIKSLNDQLTSLTVSKTKDLQNLKAEFSKQKQLLDDKLRDLDQKLFVEQTKWNETEQNLIGKVQHLQIEIKSRDDLLEKKRKNHEEQYQEWKEKLNQEITKRHTKVREIEEKRESLAAELEVIKIERDQLQQNSKKNDEELNEIKKDLLKANEIIRKLQGEVRSNHEKMKILNESKHRQDEMVSTNKSALDRLSNDLKLCLQQIKIKEKEIERLTEENSNHKQQCDQLETQLMSSKNMVKTLTGELARIKLERTKIDNEEKNRKDVRFESDEMINSTHRSKQNTKQNHRYRSESEQRYVNFQIDDERDDEEEPPQQKNYLFSNVSKELPLKNVNIRTTSANRNQTNVMSSQINTKRRSLI
ncbi:voltage-gated channel [Sarcoptes scabiei]|nr:voltage-gated channel [Sarcoptes scabiei]